jgi:chemotaxis protein MotB
MGLKEKQVEPEGDPGAPEWMVTFSDCMTLLLTFFVLLLSFSSFDDKIFLKFRETLLVDLPSLHQQVRRSRDSVVSFEEIRPKEELETGSEKATLENKSKINLLKEKEPKEFHMKKVFVGDSDWFFWGKGTAISAWGRRTLEVLGAFLKRVPGRVVISENGLIGDKKDEQLGLARAWTVMESLTREQGLDKARFSISAASTLAQWATDKHEPTPQRTKDRRMLEIVILERSISN